MLSDARILELILSNQKFPMSKKWCLRQLLQKQIFYNRNDLNVKLRSKLKKNCTHNWIFNTILHSTSENHAALYFLSVTLVLCCSIATEPRSRVWWTLCPSQASPNSHSINIKLYLPMERTQHNKRLMVISFVSSPKEMRRISSAELQQSNTFRHTV